MNARLEKTPFPQYVRNEVLPYAEPHADEISLIDLALVLYRRRQLVFTVTALTFLMGLALALIKTPNYHYTTPLILAATLESTQGGNAIQLVESPQDVATRLTEALIPAALRKIAQHDRLVLDDIPLAEVKVTGGSQLLLSSKAPEEQFPLVKAVHQEVLNMLQTSLDKQISAMRDQYMARLRRTELKLAELKDPAVFAVRQEEMQQAIETAQLALHRIAGDRRIDEQDFEGKRPDTDPGRTAQVDQESWVRGRLAEQRAAEAMLRDRVGAMRRQLAVTDDRREPGETRLLEERLAVLERERVSVSEGAAKLELQLVELHVDHGQKVQALRLELEQRKMDYENFRANHERALFLQEQQTAELRAVASRILKTVASQIRTTSAADLAVQSIKPIGPGKNVILAMSLVLGLMLAIFVAYFAEFLSKAKAQLGEC